MFPAETSKTNLTINRDNEKKTTNKGSPRFTFILGDSRRLCTHTNRLHPTGKNPSGTWGGLKSIPKATHKSTANKVQRATSLKIKSYSYMMV